jgi:hypothetical protein
MNTELVTIDDLTPDPANARKHGERNLSSIIDSLRAFGQQKPIVVDRRGVVIAGNGTLEAAKRLGWEEIAIVRTELDPTQATAFGIADNRTAELAEWDEDVLVSLLDSLDDETRDLLAFDHDDLAGLLEQSVNAKGIDGTYTTKIEPPIYEITGESPDVDSLFDRSKTEELLEEIATAQLPQEVAAFLRFAAERHTVFDFRRIAEFYAHGDEATQDLMERSALVIVDFDKAIESGFVRLSNEIADLVDVEKGNA